MTEHLQHQDDFLHPPAGPANWRESFYFGFYDQAGRAGITYISISPHQRTIAHVVILLLPGNGANLVFMLQEPFSDLGDSLLERGPLHFRCLKPLQHWQLQAEVDCLSAPRSQEVSSVLAAARTGTGPAEPVPVAFDLHFEGRMPAYRYPSGGLDFLGQGQQHFDQMGRVAGRLRIGGEETVLDGLGGRDRSWGVRDWLRHEWYNWINLNLEGDLYVGVTLSRVEGQEAGAGFVCQDGRFQTVGKVDVEADRDPGDLHLLSGRIRLPTEQVPTLYLDCSPISFFHSILAREGTWQDHDCVTLVSCRWGERLGWGFWEHARREPASPAAAGKVGLL